MKLMLMLALSVGLAHATVIFTPGPGNIPGDYNVLMMAQETGNTTMGGFNQFATPDVQFTSTQTITDPSNGQARVEATQGSLNNLSFALTDNFGFGTAMFNLFRGGQNAGNGGTATVVATDTNGNVFSFEYDLGRGENFLRITTADNQSIANVAITVPGGFSDLRQLRIGTILDQDGNGPGPNPEVPEPSTLAMMGIGAGLLGLRAFRK